jgi:hypothetical protein
MLQTLTWPTRAPDNFQVQRVITPYFWKWWVFEGFFSRIQDFYLHCLLCC